MGPVEVLELLVRHEVVGAPRVGHEHPSVAVLVRRRGRPGQRLLEYEIAELQEPVGLAEHVGHGALHASDAMRHHVEWRQHATLRSRGNAEFLQEGLEIGHARHALPEFPAGLDEILKTFLDLGVGGEHREGFAGPRLDPRVLQSSGSFANT